MTEAGNLEDLADDEEDQGLGKVDMTMPGAKRGKGGNRQTAPEIRLWSQPEICDIPGFGVPELQQSTGVLASIWKIVLQVSAVWSAIGFLFQIMVVDTIY